MSQKPSSSSSSATPTHQSLYPPRSASNSSSNTQSTSTLTPAIIPLDYNYQTMSPSSLSQFRNDRITSASNTNTTAAYHMHPNSRLSRARPSGTASVDVELDNQYSSLFGDPVPPPPPPDFLTTQFDPVTLFRPSLDISSGSEEDAFGRLESLETDRATNTTRLFSNVPFSSVFSKRNSDTPSQRNFDVLPTPMPRLQPPDIQILPNSSGGSSSEARESPNYALLTPDDGTLCPAVYDVTQASDVTEIVESLEVRDAKGVREYSEAKRRVSNFSEDFKSNVGGLSNTQETEIGEPPSTAGHPFPRQFSNESYTSSEWFRPAAQDYPEFSKIPRLRPSSKNIMSIKREEMPMHHSPVAAMINDSNGSSSGEERLADKTQIFEQETVPLDILQPPARPPDPSPSLLREIETDLLLSPQAYLQHQGERLLESVNEPNFRTPPPPAKPPPPDFISPIPGESQDFIEREMSPVILRDSIVTGGDFRVDQPRLHKKTSFTIISEKTPQSSRNQSPSPYSQQQRSPSKISVLSNSSSVKPIAKPRQYLQRKSLSSTQLKLPQLPQQRLQGTVDDSPRPSVQFNMTGRHTPNMMTQRGILQHRESLSSSQDITPLSPSAALMSTSKLRRPSALPSFAKSASESKIKSSEALPLITDPYRTSIPRLNRSITDLHREPAVFPPGALPRPLKPNPNPTRKQKGLLRILNGDTSHIPLRSNWASMDDLSVGRQLKTPLSTPLRGLQTRRRSSSTSPERRSSTQTASDRRSSNLSSITTSDFSFRRPSMTTQLQLRKSLFPTPSPRTKRRQSLITPASLTSGRTSRTKIAKPSTLSPILGTPNKDSSTPQSPEQNGVGSLAPSETMSDVTSRRDSLSRIPVRGTRPGSRSSSPLKEFTAQLPLSDPNSRGASSRTASRATARTDISQSASRANSRSASRSTSRASTRQISRTASRSSTRPNSRMEMAKEIANSRSNSRMSMRSITSVAGNFSPIPGKRSVEPSPTPSHYRKSISVSPVFNRRARARRQSLSPPNKKRSGSRGREKKVRDRSESRQSSRSRIPLRAGSVTKSTRSSSKTRVSKRSSSSRSLAKAKLAKGVSRISPTRTPTNQRTKSTSAKKAPTSVHKPESSVKRTPSSVNKQTASVKKQPSNLPKPVGINLRRETSNVRKRDTTPSSAAKVGRRETTATAPKTSKAGASAAAVALAAGGLKRQTISKTLGKATAKGVAAATKRKQGENKMGAAIAKGTQSANKPGEVTQAGDEKSADGREASGSPIEMEAAKAATTGVAVATTAKRPANASSGSTGSSGSTSGMKRNPSNVSLVRMASRMSLLSMKRSDSNLSKKANIPSVAEEATKPTKTNGKPATLQKSNSRAQLKTPENVAALPAAILEKSQKTLENIQKTVSEATDEIQKKIHENLTDLKSLESDMGRLSDSAASPTSSVATVVENKAGIKAGAAGGGGAVESISRSGTTEESTAAGNAANDQSSVMPVASTQRSPLPPTQPIEADVSVLTTAAQATQHATVAAAAAAAATTGAMAMPNAGVVDATVERVSERAISVMPDVDCDDANFQNYAYEGDGAADKTADGAVNATLKGETHAKVTGGGGNGQKGIGGGGGVESAAHRNGNGGDDNKRRSPDGQGGSAAGSGNGSRELLKQPEDDSVPPTGCCRCCSKFCLPCRRLRCSRCCRRKPGKTGDESEEPVLSATSSASTTNLEVIDEARHSAHDKTKSSCWQKLNCCKRCRKQPKIGTDSTDEQAKMTAIGKTETAAAAATAAAATTTPSKEGKCGLCMSKLFCCRRVNKVDPTTGDETELKKCCFCIPCRRKKGGRGASIGSTVSRGSSVAWQDPETGIAATDASVVEGASSPEMLPPQGCCKRFWNKLLCCRRNKVPKPSESRRASMKAPPPPSEDTRRKLHVDLVEYNSKMKGAIPVLPLSLAWFCVICNTIVPGLGTLFSGIFCLCVGIPRFSQYDSAKARFGSFIINIIVAVAQLFCVLFCFVGWGWSIWWGTIMLKCARKLSKIKKVERLEMEEERRQAEAAAAAAATAARVTANAGVGTAAAAPATTESAT
ncbi:PREDICTED: protein stum-like [Rhagoletis zephyria]|uniref:protein stum-like n=1 Tax=Rhagoletis zephyria TaxID=28612 RepID=UPI00081125BB|nr:PREDICTED: protein stum-like [Rhagoletis zephyria]